MAKGHSCCLEVPRQGPQQEMHAIPLLLLCMYHLYGEAQVQMSAMRALYNFCLGDTQCKALALKHDVIEYVKTAQRNFELDDTLQRYAARLLDVFTAAGNWQSGNGKK